jgi:hypothetical protein
LLTLAGISSGAGKRKGREKGKRKEHGRKENGMGVSVSEIIARMKRIGMGFMRDDGAYALLGQTLLKVHSAVSR